ncbi:type II toxin-antitoxin system VapC family toxin [Altericista sp. CCNU0014]|uniref:type II toxin-antitoxin system VapC family toxin n=1 Tax=Altericista sp. CCNU0014 TaxID=3082949 RepID=UPI00384B2E71
MSSSYVLDASAILALLNNEPGADRVQAALTDAVCYMSVVNWSEVARKLVLRGRSTEAIARNLMALGLEFKDFSYHQATATAQILASPLSLGDRACLALSLDLGITALTADKIWQTLATGASVELIC